MDPNFTNENDPWEYSLDIDDFDLNLTPLLCSSSSARVEPSPYTPNPVRIIPGPEGTVQVSSSTCFEPSSSTPNPVRIIPGHAGLVQRAKQLKENVFILDPDGALMSTQEYMQKVVEDVGEDSDFNSGAWISATNYVLSTGGTVTGCLGDINNFLEKRKLKQVVAIVKSCSPNCLGDINVTMKDLSGAAMILANVSVFTPKPLEHYLNITKKNVIKDELHQLAKDEEALKEVLEEEAKREKENAIYNKKLEEYWKEEQAHDELFRMEFGVKSDSEYETD
ncbi:transposase, MuDR, MULE transposase domain protein [Tanacetum coccineum]